MKKLTVSGSRSNRKNSLKLRYVSFSEKWLGKMVEYNFTSCFRNSLCQFPSDPRSSTNPTLFAECIVKLWIHKLLRMIHGIEEDNSVETSIASAEFSLPEFFKMNVHSFISKYLPLFGMPADSTFQCLRLGPDGVPSAVCTESLPARQIGLHIRQCHTRPLFWSENCDPQKKLKFIPFTLIFHQNPNLPILENKSVFDTLSMVRSVVERWSRGSTLPYLKLLETIQSNEVGGIVSSNIHSNSTRRDNSDEKKNSIEVDEEEVASKSLAQKRKHASDENGSFNHKRHHPDLSDTESD